MSEKIKFTISDFRIGMKILFVGEDIKIVVDRWDVYAKLIKNKRYIIISDNIQIFEKVIQDVKPVLRTLDTMTDEEAIEIKEICQLNVNSKKYWIDEIPRLCLKDNESIRLMNYLEKKSFTFAGYSANELIEKGQAVKK